MNSSNDSSGLRWIANRTRCIGSPRSLAGPGRSRPGLRSSHVARRFGGMTRTAPSEPRLVPTQHGNPPPRVPRGRLLPGLRGRERTCRYAGTCEGGDGTRTPRSPRPQPAPSTGTSETPAEVVREAAVDLERRVADTGKPPPRPVHLRDAARPGSG